MKFTTTGFYPQCFRIEVLYFFDSSSQEKLSALFSKYLGISFGDLPEVHNSGARNQHPPDALRIWLELLYLRRAEHLQAGNTVFTASPKEFGKGRELLIARRYDHLPANLMLDIVGRAETDEFIAARRTQTGLKGTGPVVESGMNDAAVMPGLVSGNHVLLL